MKNWFRYSNKVWVVGASHWVHLLLRNQRCCKQLGIGCSLLASVSFVRALSNDMGLWICIQCWVLAWLLIHGCKAVLNLFFNATCWLPPSSSLSPPSSSHHHRHRHHHHHHQHFCHHHYRHLHRDRHHHRRPRRGRGGRTCSRSCSHSCSHSRRLMLSRSRSRSCSSCSRSCGRSCESGEHVWQGFCAYS